MTRKIALITGANRGLGKNTALHLAAQGVAIIGTYRSNAAEAAALVQQIEGDGGSAAMLQLDVGDSASFIAFVESVKELLRAKFGADQLDYLVNNAGMGIHAAIADMTEQQFDELMSVHLKGPFFLTQKLLPSIVDGGRIVNVSSGLARFSFPGYAAYAMMKGGIEVMTRYMAKEFGARGITVNTIAPGAIETDFGGGAVRDNAELNQMVASMTALGRVGQPDDIGGAIAALLSDGNRWVNAQRIEVSGGMLI
ncbi:SDR family NAD(P)-dependent oxidoreductase [Herminiimonas fonticola]|uniref:NAD(P)-dependent dehydrogenase (Short-subunit alcohol dehydrogenase family) n=1 Tax=Herminiimonas fonticola TaxID=303380 RepID=A0A4V3BWD4_9BURK|nr:SDR family oxidoreductase [Herminiimonas fonticola]RBA25374.1 Dehydrogenases with different specificities (related to short-chain alcohol dehydrogenases) [Herminiimonas fonticola]TDN94488.1 NAD(P)-dependent dehydrogenase (short-subunit alcohol dehydrogenase family) [Herminiimonas fonticola]